MAHRGSYQLQTNAASEPMPGVNLSPGNPRIRELTTPAPVCTGISIKRMIYQSCKYFTQENSYYTFLKYFLILILFSQIVEGREGREGRKKIPQGPKLHMSSYVFLKI